MAWKEPGGSKEKDPWGGGNRGGGGSGNLEDMIKRMQDKFNGMLRGKGRGGGSSSNASSLIGLVVGIVIAIWFLSGIYIVAPAERGVEMRFGKYSDTTLPGPHWHLPYPIESVEIVDVDQRRSVEIGYRTAGGGRTAVSSTNVPHESLMLTQDENIIDIQFFVQFIVQDAKDYLFSVRGQETTLRQATESAVREVIGKSKMDFVLTEGRSEIASAVTKQIQTILDRYHSGVVITQVTMQAAQAPKEVKAAFDDAIKAREDQQRLRNEAETYSNDVLPKARGSAARLMEEAKAYRQSVIAQAEGEAERFERLLTEYRKAPEVTRKRMYLEAMEGVMSNTNKVVIDVKKGNNMIYLPLDKMAPPARESTGPIGSVSQPAAAAPLEQSPQALESLRERENQRGRERR
ncbi:MAG: FtsH protease activity modulator HflK [Gammaproteobacteria bacterium]|nr:FtsH protease activity modulator HflK [Gammaproteobacteria bacterium]